MTFKRKHPSAPGTQPPPDPDELTSVLGLRVCEVRFWGGQRPLSPLLVLHALEQTPSVWTPVAEELGRQGRWVIAPRLWTPRPRLDATRLDAMRQEVQGVLTNLRVQQFDVAGIGAGGALAWILAALLPGSVRSVASFPADRLPGGLLAPPPGTVNVDKDTLAAALRRTAFLPAASLPPVTVPSLMVPCSAGSTGDEEEGLRTQVFEWFPVADGLDERPASSVPGGKPGPASLEPGPDNSLNLLIPWLQMLSDVRRQDA